jgi:hypothetical protein
MSERIGHFENNESKCPAFERFAASFHAAAAIQAGYCCRYGRLDFHTAYIRKEQAILVSSNLQRVWLEKYKRHRRKTLASTICNKQTRFHPIRERTVQYGPLSHKSL